MRSYWTLHKYPIFMVLGSVLFYVTFAYNLEREDFPKLLCLFVALFFLTSKLIQLEKWNFKFLAFSGILFRLLLFAAEPNLSQDFYRFIWDGELITQGLSPYLYSPNQIIGNASFHIHNGSVLHEGMGSLSAKHYSNYPPLNQIIFAIASFLGNGSVFGSILVMRIFIIGADIGILYFGKKLLQQIGNSQHLIWWYFLNPLVVIELTGNLHFEGVMLFFFIWAIYLISLGKWKSAAPIYAGAIMIKLVPLLFLPLFLKYFGFKRSMAFYTLVGVTCLIFLLPFIDGAFIDNYSKTVGLWFSNFEFNASVYNLVKATGIHFFDAKPWLLIRSYGNLVPKIMILVALALTFMRPNTKLPVLFGSMLALLSCYYFLSSTVHPWYIIFLLTLSIFTKYRFALVWSAAAVLSYFTYSHENFKENMWILAIEYLLVIGYFGYEVIKNRNILSRFRKKLGPG